MAADQVQRYPRREFHVAVVKDDPSGIDVAHHLHYLIRLVGGGEKAVRHVAPRRIHHFLILQVKARFGKEIEVADVIVMQVRDDDILHLVRIHPQFRQAFPG